MMAMGWKNLNIEYQGLKITTSLSPVSMIFSEGSFLASYNFGVFKERMKLYG
ncbi:hypothetical protein [Bathymodiolus japonicus methanotrophic gill symbiont]|uniref:hypothetical protein n=1 Tax=Bathymodiolus japonicus methanotrophic gill symbiont TaxID=113269 RepID=UPI001C8EFCC8|nr:hypothetical protein [Bathymodiolus japonicus methanotrophic gill symbiont]